MLMQWSQLIFLLFLILIASYLFTNAIEYAGEKLGLSEGATGSVFAAIATALPETTVPIIAIVYGTSNTLLNQQISVGAILGAPLMLSTLSTLLLALSALKSRGIKGVISPEKIGFTRDLNFFLMAFTLAALAMYLPHHPVYLRAFVSLLLVSLYFYYLVQTFKASNQLVSAGHGVMPEEPLILTRFGFGYSVRTILIQVFLGITLLMIGAKGFIHGVETISNTLSISALVLSLLIIPIATELPEKVNSILWVRKNKDTLGFGNITGSMVFQGTLLPALGILLTPWEPSKEVLTGMFITFAATLWMRLNIRNKGLPIVRLFVNGGLYITYLYLTLR